MRLTECNEGILSFKTPQIFTQHGIRTECDREVTYPLGGVYSMGKGYGRISRVTPRLYRLRLSSVPTTVCSLSRMIPSTCHFTSPLTESFTYCDFNYLHPFDWEIPIGCQKVRQPTAIILQLKKSQMRCNPLNSLNWHTARSKSLQPARRPNASEYSNTAIPG